jgi:hypothetical protein
MDSLRTAHLMQNRSNESKEKRPTLCRWCDEGGPGVAGQGMENCDLQLVVGM